MLECPVNFFSFYGVRNRITMFISSDIKGTSIDEHALAKVSLLNGHSRIDDILSNMNRRR